MPSTLAWIDHDTRAQDRARRIIALFQERGTVDQMGIGSIRDSFADLFFPGTSTIQTRLRYFLFVPWIYQRIEQEEVPSRRAAEAAREIELALVLPLLSQRDGGIFGSMAGQELKRLPSEVYWGGLGSWGIRRFDASPGRYHRGLDELYRRRKRAARDHSEDDVGEGSDDARVGRRSDRSISICRAVTQRYVHEDPSWFRRAPRDSSNHGSATRLRSAAEVSSMRSSIVKRT